MELAEPVSTSTLQLHGNQQPARQAAVQQREEEEDNGKGETEREERKEERMGEGEMVRGRVSEEVAENVTDWVTVKRKKRSKSRKTVQIFVKVDGSKTRPMDV